MRRRGQGLSFAVEPLGPSFVRYHRQMLLPGVGAEGQARLAGGHAIIVGVGALGCAAGDLLVRAGVGTVTLIDRDVVELTNLQRQTLFDEQDANAQLPKAVAAAARLSRVNSCVRVNPVVADLVAGNAEQLLLVGGAGGPCCIVDGTDNFETRYLLNDVSVKHGIAYAYGGAVGTRGMACTFMPGGPGPCLRCVFEQAPAPGASPTCDTAGVLGSAVAIVAACQATDAIKLLLERIDLVSASLLDFDLWSNARRRIDVSRMKSASCPCCAGRRFEFLDGGAGSDTTVLCGQNAVQVAPGGRGDGVGTGSIDLAGVADRLRPHGSVVETRFMVRAKARPATPGDSPLEITVFQDGRAIIRGTTRPEVARSVYAKYVGA